MRLLRDDSRERQTGAAFCAQENRNQSDGRSRNKDGPKVYFDALSIEVVLDNAAIPGVDKTNDQVEETQKRPGQEIRGVGLVSDVRYDREDHDHQCRNSKGKVKGGFAR